MSRNTGRRRKSRASTGWKVVRRSYQAEAQIAEESPKGDDRVDSRKCNDKGPDPFTAQGTTKANTKGFQPEPPLERECATA